MYHDLLSIFLSFSQKTSSSFFAFVSGLIGLSIFFLVYSPIFNPTDLSWIFADGWDTFQHHIGWEFFRQAPWTFPIGNNLLYGYPVGIPISYTDSIPILAFLFKLIQSLLPSTFQFQGLFIAISFFLQGYFGFLLVSRVTRSRTVGVIGSIFFSLSPILHFRVSGHAALTAHWLVLWSLLLVLERARHLRVVRWTAVLLLSLLIHPYFVFLCAPIMVADICRVWLVEKTICARRVVLYLAVQGYFLLVVGHSIGLFHIGSAGDTGFGDFSMNLNAFVNPFGWMSPILPEFPIGPMQFEGFGYLGVAVLALLVLSTTTALVRYRDILYQFVRVQWPLLVVSFVLFLIAVGPVAMIGEYILFQVPVPAFLEQLFSIIRASGRMMWPVYYLLLLASFFVFRMQKNKVVATVFVVLTLGLHTVDMFPPLRFHHDRLVTAASEPSHLLVDDFWNTVAREYDHIAYVPDYVRTIAFRTNSYAPLAFFAATHGMSLNTGYFARPIAGNNEHLKSTATALVEGTVDSETLYIISKTPERYTSRLDSSVHFIGVVDGYMLIAPYLREQHKALSETLAQ